MKVEYGEGQTEFGPGVCIKLTGDEVASAIFTYITAHDIHINGARTIRINNQLCSPTEIYVDPSGFVIYKGEKFSGRGKSEEEIQEENHNYEEGKNMKEYMDEDQKKYLRDHKNCGLKVGDTVKILRSCSSHSSGWMNSWETEMNHTIGEIGNIIIDMKKEGFALHFPNKKLGSDYSFPYFVLEKIAKYEIKIPLTLRNFWIYLCADRLGDNWKDHLIRRFAQYGFTSEIPLDEILEYARETNEIDWLIKNGFLKLTEKKQERYYSIGNEFSVGGNNYIISSVSTNEIIATNIDTGGRLHNKTYSENQSKITENEVRGIFSNILKFEDAEWTKIGW